MIVITFSAALGRVDMPDRMPTGCVPADLDVIRAMAAMGETSVRRALTRFDRINALPRGISTGATTNRSRHNYAELWRSPGEPLILYVLSDTHNWNEKEST